MIRLNRTTEYGMIALRTIASCANASSGNRSVSAREIAEKNGLPFEITAKTLQKMKDAGFIVSLKGAQGGYSLLKPLSGISVLEFLMLMEGPQGVASCCIQETCEYDSKCDIKGFVSQLNRQIMGVLSNVKLSEMMKKDHPERKMEVLNESV